MRYYEIVEARKNANLPQQEKEYLESYLNSLPSLDDIYIHYTDVDKIGINPRSDWYETPPGIYTYKVSSWYAGPGNYVGVRWKPGFAQNSRYVFVLRVKPSARLLNFGDYSYEQFVKDSKLLGVSPTDLFPNAESEKEIESIEPNRLARRIYSTAFRSKKPPTAFTKVLGYDGIEDPGYGFIHKNEEQQTVFFSRSAFEVLKQLRDYPNKHKHKYKRSKEMNAQQVLWWAKQGNWRGMPYLNGQQIDLPADLQMELLNKKNQFATRPGPDGNEWLQAVQAVSNPTDEFFKALIDSGNSWFIKDSQKASPAIKSYLLKKKPLEILGMPNPPPDAEKILQQHYDSDVVQKLMTLVKK